RSSPATSRPGTTTSCSRSRSQPSPSPSVAPLACRWRRRTGPRSTQETCASPWPGPARRRSSQRTSSPSRRRHRRSTMAASKDRATPIRNPEGGAKRGVFPVKGSTTIYKGTLVALNAGYAAPAADTSGLLVVGIAEEQVINAGADGAVSINVLRSVSALLATTGVVIGDVGKTAYVSDDQTVTDAPGNAVIAGFIEEYVTSATAWVAVGKVS